MLPRAASGFVPLWFSRCDRATMLRIQAPVAQLDRASGFEPEGRRFESVRARQIIFPAQRVRSRHQWTEVAPQATLLAQASICGIKGRPGDDCIPTVGAGLV